MSTHNKYVHVEKYEKYYVDIPSYLAPKEPFIIFLPSSRYELNNVERM